MIRMATYKECQGMRSQVEVIGMRINLHITVDMEFMESTTEFESRSDREGQHAPFRTYVGEHH